MHLFHASVKQVEQGFTQLAEYQLIEKYSETK